MTASVSREDPGWAGKWATEARGPGRADFSIVVGRFLGTVVVTLAGTLDALAATRLGATLQDLIDGQGNLAIAIDLRGVCQVAPSGLQVLSDAAYGIERRGGRLSLSDPPDAIRCCLDSAGLSRLVGSPRTKEADADLSQDARGREGSIEVAASAIARAHHPAGRARAVDRSGG
jgi:anti-anti-sigma factor